MSVVPSIHHVREKIALNRGVRRWGPVTPRLELLRKTVDRSRRDAARRELGKTVLIEEVTDRRLSKRDERALVATACTETKRLWINRHNGAAKEHDETTLFIMRLQANAE